ncbi:hypothetical protein [Oceanicola sp. S124]|uniref:hypothetical protein n=1 Tax=Oceanicola sp. S124 TaxID=1042378 RepID=UPI0002558D66|nr:hypothetical protein [Oceanicola sp. S124]
MSTSPKIRRLAPVARATGIAFEAELMHLRRIASRERQLRLSLEALERRATERFLDTVDRTEGADPGYVDGQDRAWRDWVSVRRSNLQAELALVLAEKADRMVALSKSLGRRDVAARMHADSRAEDRRAALARDLATLQDLAVLMNGARREQLH